MSEENQQRHSHLIAVLREGIGVIQMVLFKELRSLYSEKYPQEGPLYHSMLAGAIINALFHTENSEEKFRLFKRDNYAIIEQALLGIAEQMAHLRTNVTDALRVQVLCDEQEGVNRDDSARALLQAAEIGVLIRDRELPLPSVFMTRVRNLGEKHGLTMAPLSITDIDDKAVIH